MGDDKGAVREYTIRYATEEDVPEILAMIRELADYEHELDAVEATETSLLKTLSFPSSTTSLAPSNSSTTPPSFAPAGYAKTLLIFSSSSPTIPAGLALFFNNYSTWRSSPGIYVEDLFVRPAHRGKGFGVALLQRLAQETVAIGGGRLEWSVLKWNEPSIRFYESEAIGANMMSEWVGMRVERERLVKLAGGVGLEGLSAL